MTAIDPTRLGGRLSDEDALAVAMPSQPWVLPLGIGAAVLLGGAVFWQLNTNRLEEAQASEAPPPNAYDPAAGIEPAPMPEAIYMEPPSASEPPLEEIVIPPPIPARQSPAAPALEERLRSPALVVDLTQPASPTATTAVTAAAVAQAIAPAAARNADEDFASRLGFSNGDASARAERMTNQSFTVAEGSVIPAVLETAIHSDLPGYVRAVVSRDVHSFDGANVLVPRGSRLVGQYRAGVALGQSRAFVIWTRLIRPDGVSIELGAPGTDALGRGGLEGRVDRHFLQRFGGAILLSLISAGSALATDSSDTQVIIASGAGAANSAASTALQSDLNIAPTVEVAQGAPIRVFVTRDLDFSVLNEPEPG
jgi:type IV secretion system protein VirB10